MNTAANSSRPFLLRALKRLLLALAAVLLLLVCGLAWLTGTTSGARLALTLAGGTELELAEVHGRLWGSLELVGVTWTTPEVQLELGQAQIEWRPRLLFDRKLHIRRVSLSDVALTLTTPQQQDNSQPPTALPAKIELPLAVQLDQLDLRDAQICTPTVCAATSVERLSAAAQGTTLELNWEGSRAQLHPTDAQAAKIPGLLTASGNASVSLVRDYPLTTSVALTVTEPELGTLTGNLELATNVQGQKNFELQKFGLQGDLLGNPLNTAGSGTYAADQLRINPTSFNWAGISGLLEGQLDATGGAANELRANLNAESLQPVGKLLGQQLAGTLEGEVQVRGSLTEPMVTARLAAAHLAVAGATVTHANVSLAIGQAATDRLLIDAHGTEVTYADVRLSEFELNAAGTNADHQFSVQLQDSTRRAQLAGSGQLQALERWAFDLRKLDLHVEPAKSALDNAALATNERADTATAATPQKYRFGLAQPLTGKLQFEPVELTSSALCLRQLATAATGRACLELPAGVTPQTTPSLNAQLSNFDLRALTPFLPADLRLSGELNGVASWPGGLAGARVELKGSKLLAERLMTSGWQPTLRLGPSRLQIDGSAASATLVLELPLLDEQGHAAGGVTGGLLLDDLDLGELSDTVLQGELAIDVPDIAVLSASAGVAMPVEGLSGSARGRLSISGPASAPVAEGRAKVALTSVAIPDLGIRLADTTLSLLARDTGIAFNGSASTQPLIAPELARAVAAAQQQGRQLASAEQQLRVSGEAAWEGALTVTAQIIGSNVLLADNNEALVRISPDLRLTFTGEQLGVDGSVDVPLARLTLKNVPRGAVSVSPDQILTGAPAEQPGPAVAADILLRLGDQVTFDGLGLEASFGGELRVQQAANALPTAIGEIQIKEGRYQAYGQDLSVTDGRILFAGGPLDAPGLDVRAVRQATPEVEVGVHALGALAAPRFSVFSTPALPQSDQLSYLILGRPMSGNDAAESSLLQQAAMAVGVQGGSLFTDKLGSKLGVDTLGIESAPGTGNQQAALVIGKYLSPRLYVSYGYGLFEPISTLRFDYRLSRLWRIVTESSNEATGGDVQWVLEK